jgi:hypothetical protein
VSYAPGLSNIPTGRATWVGFCALTVPARILYLFSTHKEGWIEYVRDPQLDKAFVADIPKRSLPRVLQFAYPPAGAELDQAAATAAQCPVSLAPGTAKLVVRQSADRARLGVESFASCPVPRTEPGAVCRLFIERASPFYAERKRAAFAVDRREHTITEAFTLTVECASEESAPTDVVVEEEFPRFSAWAVTAVSDASIAHERVSPFSEQFVVPLPGGKASRSVSYTVTYSGWLLSEEVLAAAPAPAPATPAASAAPTAAASSAAEPLVQEDPHPQRSSSIGSSIFGKFSKSSDREPLGKQKH